MPEILEVELYRSAAEAALGRTIADVSIRHPSYVRQGLGVEALRSVLVDREFTAARRRGKLMLLDFAGEVLGVRFAMTGRLIVDDFAVIEELEYSSGRDDDSWDQFVVTFSDGGHLKVRDQRRLGTVELNPDEGDLGVDAFSLNGSELTSILNASSRPLKARIMDQRHISGLGNLLTDEILWRSSLDPAMAADSLTSGDRRRLLRHLRTTLAELMERGGSHMGDLQPERHDQGRCPKDGAELVKRTIGGRTTYACSEHQWAQD